MKNNRSLAPWLEGISRTFAALRDHEVPHALMGGMAMAVYGVLRATRGVDILVDVENSKHLCGILSSLGYRQTYRATDAAGYTRGPESLNVLYARRPMTRQLIADAAEYQTVLGPIRIVSAEGLIGLNLQALVNHILHTRHIDDIRALLCVRQGQLDMEQVKTYFDVFARADLLRGLLAELKPASVRCLLPGGMIVQPEQSDMSGWVGLMRAVRALDHPWPASTARSGRDYRL